MAQPTAFIIGFFVLAIVIGFFIIRSGAFVRNREETNDPRRGLQPNNTNYNESMFSEEELRSMSKKEAQVFIERVRKGELSALSPRDFAILQEKVGE